MDTFGKAGHCSLNLERIEVVEASKLTVATREFTENHGRILELVAKVLDVQVLKACQIEPVLQRRHEEHLSFGPQCQSHVYVPVA